MWRLASRADDDVVIGMCLSLNREDPGPRPVRAEQVLRTLRTLRGEPHRGRALVLELEGRVVGYALLIPYWSNELGGEVCSVDELYVAPGLRGTGLATSFLRSLHEDRSLWPRRPAALAIGVSAANVRARALYERVGFTAANLTLIW